MSLEKMTQLALELQKLGVSQDGSLDILLKYPIDVIEAQLSYMPMRRAKRPEAFIVEAIRKNYSPPNNAYYAKAKAELAAAINAVDKSPQRPVRQADPEPKGHGAPNPPDLDPEHEWVEPGGAVDHDDLPDFDGEVR